MNRLPRSILTVLLVTFAATGCRSCHPAPPDEYTIAALPDPYAKLGPRIPKQPVDRAVHVIDGVARTLGYGAAPAEFARHHATDAWMATPLQLIDAGDVTQLKAAWDLLGGGLVADRYLSNQTRFKAKEAQARIWDYENTHQPEEFMRKAYLSEIAWCLWLIHGLDVDGGHP